MKAIRIIYDGPTNQFTRKGAIIGWVIPARDGTGFYSSYGARQRKNFFGCKYATPEAAEAAIRKINSNLPENVEITSPKTQP